MKKKIVNLNLNSQTNIKETKIKMVVTTNEVILALNSSASFCSQPYTPTAENGSYHRTTKIHSKGLKGHETEMKTSLIGRSAAITSEHNVRKSTRLTVTTEELLL